MLLSLFFVGTSWTTTKLASDFKYDVDVICLGYIGSRCVQRVLNNSEEFGLVCQLLTVPVGSGFKLEVFVKRSASCSFIRQTKGGLSVPYPMYSSSFLINKGMVNWCGD